MVANDRRLFDIERIEQGKSGIAPALDGILCRPLGIAEADGIHGNGPVPSAEDRQHVAVLVPGTRRLMQQQHGKPRAVAGDMDAPATGLYEGPLRAIEHQSVSGSPPR